MYHTNFVHLHVHSHYSILDGAAPVKLIVEAARRFRMPAIAITDHGNMFGAIDFYQTALKRGVKPILGFESYLTPKSRFEKTGRKDEPTYHLVLLARNMTGYKNLIKLSTLAYTEGFYYKPRVDFEILEKYRDGLLGMGACLQGEVPYKLLRGDREGAVKAIRRYQDLFGKENFYLEVQDHGLTDQRTVLPLIVEVARACDVPLVATNDSHYVNQEDWEAHDALLCLQTQSVLKDEKRFKFGSREFYMKSPQLMTELFRDLPDAITNTLKVAEKCNVQLTLGKSILPNFPIPNGKTADSFLMELCDVALPGRYPNPDQVVSDRLAYELSVIRKMGFSDYFLIVWDLIRHAMEVGVPVGPGRGSAAGSIVSYLLGITDIDPLRYDLLFERFLNPDRISMPDIDIDFSDEGRAKIIEYVVNKYGREKVSQIITFNYILAKLAIRDIGRIMGMGLQDVDRIAKLVPDGAGVHLKSALNEVPELKEIAEKGTTEEKKLLKFASTVDGLIRHTGVHAAGIVIARDDLMETVPLFLDKSKEIVTQYEKNSIEKIGLLKMDFLGLKTLSVIQRALTFIKETTGNEIDLRNIPVDDRPTFELLCRGLTLGVFQLESSGMRSLITQLKPSVFEDIIALLAMYRPGPLGSGMVLDFVERKHGRKAILYPHPDLEPILKDTYGVFLYQEQCMKTANVLANFTMGQADQLRKAMAKKIPEDMEKMGKLFVEGAVKRGIAQELAQQIFDLMASFGEYGFNKSHSAAYAVVTFRTAYLKTHFPVEFMSAVLSSEINDTAKISQYIDECKTMKIDVLKPDINHSRNLFSVEKGSIRFGLTAIKGVGGGAVDSILAARDTGVDFKNLSDLTRRVDTRQVNSRVIEALTKSGALDSFGLKRSQLLAIAGDALKSGQKAQKEKQSGQTTFFDLLGSEVEDMVENDMSPPNIPELTNRELLSAEKEALGFFLSGNPFEEVAPVGNIFASDSLKSLAESGDGKTARIAGLLTNCKKHSTKKGDVMAFVTIEAEDTSLDVTIFPGVYSSVSKQLLIDEPLFMVVKTQLIGSDLKINADEVLTLEDLNREGFTSLKFTIPEDKASKECYHDVLKCLRKYPGCCSFTIQISVSSDEKVILKPHSNFRVSLAAGLIRDWEAICGQGSVTANFSGITGGKERNGRSFFQRNGRANKDY